MNVPVALTPEGFNRANSAAEAEPDIVIGSREQLLHLLAEAAEIEHTLMCSYLYAAFSLNWTCPRKVESFPSMKGELDDEAATVYA